MNLKRCFKAAAAALMSLIIFSGCAAGQDGDLSGGKGAGAADDLVINLSHEDARVRAAAAWNLGKSGEEEAVQPLIGALRDEDANVREWAVLGLVRIGRPAVPALCSTLNEGNESAAWQAAAALGLIGDANASRPLREALQSGSSNVRYWAAQALGGLDDNSSKESLIFALGDENASVRYEAGLALRATEGAGAADIFIGLLQEENGSRRAGAACALGNADGSGAAPALVSALQDEQAGVRLEAARALGRLGDGSAAEPLTGLLSDENGQVRGQAIASLQAIGEPAVRPLLSVLQGANSSPEDAAEGAAIALGGIGEEGSLDALEEAFIRGGERVRIAAARAMMKINASRAGMYMITQMGSAQAPADVRADAARALGEMGDKSARGALIQAMASDSDEDVRLNAARALKSIGGGEVPEYKI